MNRILGFLIFLTLATSIYFGMHYYVYHQIVRDLELSPYVVTALQICFLAGTFSYFLGEFISRRFHHDRALYLASIWMGVISIAFTVFLAKHLLTILLPAFAPHLTIVAIGLTIVFSAWSVIKVQDIPRLKAIDITLPNLPDTLDGLTIIQLSDLHLDGLKSVQWLKQIVTEVNSHNPDVIVITGDLIEAKFERLSAFVPVLQKLRAKHGIFAISGNHDFYVGIQDYLYLLNATDITSLDNRMVTVADHLQIAGISDETGRQMGHFQPDLDAALNEIDPTQPTIFLAHQPLHFEEAAQSGVDLQLSGHTHAGQLPPLDLLVYLRFKYHYGLKQLGTSYIYTTSGTGTWGPPMRLTSQSEIVKITLRKKG